MKKNGISLCVIILSIVYIFSGNIYSVSVSETSVQNDVPPPIYRVSVAYGGHKLFEYGFSSFPMYSTSYEDRRAPENKYIYYEGKKIELHYDKTDTSYFTQKHYYTNEDGTISCGYYSEIDIDLLYNLTARNRMMFPDESVDTENEYKAWAESLIYEFRGLNFEREYGYEYVYSCESYVEKTNAKITEAASVVPGFYIPKSDEKVTKYVFNYIRYFDGCKTSDQRKVVLDLTDGTTSIYLHDDSLTELKHQCVDKDGGDQSVGRFLARKIDKYRYRLESYEITDTTLYVIDGKDCVTYDVTVNYFDIEENRSETDKYTLLVHEMLLQTNEVGQKYHLDIHT